MSAAAGSREVAYRLFAAEFDDADYSWSESDEERAPNYVISPTGARINRLFVTGVLTEVEPVNEEMVRARVVDPSGAFVVYAGQYQPDPLSFLERAEPPAFVAVTGKARTFQPEDGDRIYTSVRPEAVAAVDAATRDRWTVQAAERTLDRIGVLAAALATDRRGEDLAAALRAEGVSDGLAAGIPLAIDHYGTTATYVAAVRNLAIQALEVVAGERDEVDPIGADPAAPGDVDPAELATMTIAAGAGATPDAEAAEPTATEAAEIAASAEDASAETAAEPSPAAGEPAEDTTAETAAEDETESTAETGPLGDFDADEYELDEDERREVEATYGTEFETGTEVDDAGKAGIETPPAETAGPESDDPDVGTSSAPAESVGDEGEATESAAEPGADEADDLAAAAVATMRELDEGDGADREAVVAAVADERDVAPAAVEDAIQDALMGGECYEPDEGRLKAI